MNIAICDNEPDNLSDMRNKIMEMMGDTVSCSCHDNSFSLISHILDDSKSDVDVVIIEICLANQNGVDVAETILTEKPNIRFIFMSEHVEFIQDIFSVNPAFFLLKPIDESYLRTAIYKVRKMIDEDNVDSFRLRVGGRNILMKTRDIYYIESNRRQLLFHTYDGCVASYIRFDELENKKNFVRCHQSYLVNMDKIKEIKQDSIILYNEVLIPVSRSRQKETLERVKMYLGTQ